MKVLIKKVMPPAVVSLLRDIRNHLLDGHAVKSYAQEGEDMILRRYFENKKSGFYVDIGAHHPKRFSNTWLLYRNGWRGLNVDAMPGSMDAFNKLRARDVNVECGVGRDEGFLEYYEFNEPALNGFSKKLSDMRHEENSDYKIVGKKRIKVLPLSAILDKYLQKGQVVDFISVDVEGFDFEVLQSNDWDKYRPELILCEVLGASLHDAEENPIVKYLGDQGYSIYAKCVNTVFFRRG